MRLHVLSDLHLERQALTPVDVDADVVVLAGDVGGGTRGVEWARALARERPVLYVAGNHEFYGHAMPELLDEMRGELCERLVNDYRHIAFGPGRRPLTPHDTRSVHVASRRWLEARLAHPHDGLTVIVTHHAPMIAARPSRPVLRALAGAFASDVTDLMGGDRVALWIFGHTHRVADVEIRGTRIISNPYGYPEQEVAGFDPARVIELSPSG